MTAPQLSLNAYRNREAPLRDPRQVEYDVFAQVTRSLSQAWAMREVDHPALVRAIYDNVKLWRTLAAEVSDKDNALPAPLRAQLFYLYEFTAVQSDKVLKQEANVTALTDINLSVMRGLSGRGGAL